MPVSTPHKLNFCEIRNLTWDAKYWMPLLSKWCFEHDLIHDDLNLLTQSMLSSLSHAENPSNTFNDVNNVQAARTYV